MNITLKVKTLVKLFIFITFIAIIYLSLPSILFKISGAEKETPELDWSDPQALYNYAMKANPEENDNVIIFPSFSQRNTTHREVSAEDAIKIFEYMLQEFPNNGFTLNHVKWNLSQLYLHNGRIDKAISLLEQISNEWYSTHKRSADEQLQVLKPTTTSSAPALSGKVLVGNQPIKNVFVYLLKKENPLSWSSSSYFEYPTTLTNENGEYHFYNVPDGEYEVGVEINLSELEGFYWPVMLGDYVEIKNGNSTDYDVKFIPKINVTTPSNYEEMDGDTITFKWEPYPNAAYYQIGITNLPNNDKLGGSITLTLNEKWRGTSAVYRINDIRMDWNTVSYVSSVDGKNYLTPSSILGNLYPGGRFSWVVEAYDQNGKKLSSSAGYYLNQELDKLPIFTISNKDQLEGDRYVMDLEYEKAIASYEKEENNPFAQLALAKMYHDGLTTDDKGDPSKSLYYLQKLSNPNDQILRMMADDYNKLGNYAEEEKIYRSLIANKQSGWSDKLRLAHLQRYKNNDEEAISLYEQVQQEYAGNEASDELILLYLIHEQYEKALDIAKNYKHKYSNTDFYPLLNTIEKEGFTNKEFNEALVLLSQKKIESAQKLIQRMRAKDPSYYEFLNMLGNELYPNEYLIGKK